MVSRLIASSPEIEVRRFLWEGYSPQGFLTRIGYRTRRETVVEISVIGGVDLQVNKAQR
jgi:hypothetical protein